MAGFFDFLKAFLGGVFVLIIVSTFIGAVVSVGLAPQSGDVFYPVWSYVTRNGWQVLLLVVPGVAGAAYVISEMLDSGGF